MCVCASQTAPAASIRQIVISPAAAEGEAKRDITETEVEALQELEELIESTESRLRFHDAKIQEAIQARQAARQSTGASPGGPGAGAAAATDAEGAGASAEPAADEDVVADGDDDGDDDEDEDVEEAQNSLTSVASLDEARDAMKLLFRMVVSAKKNERQQVCQHCTRPPPSHTHTLTLQCAIIIMQHDAVEDLQLKLSTAEQELAAVQQRARIQQVQYERQMSALQAEFEQEQAVFLALANSDDADADVEADEEDGEADDANAKAGRQSSNAAASAASSKDAEPLQMVLTDAAELNRLQVRSCTLWLLLLCPCILTPPREHTHREST